MRYEAASREEALRLARLDRFDVGRFIAGAFPISAEARAAAENEVVGLLDQIYDQMEEAPSVTTTARAWRGGRVRVELEYGAFDGAVATVWITFPARPRRVRPGGR